MDVSEPLHSIEVRPVAVAAGAPPSDLAVRGWPMVTVQPLISTEIYVEEAEGEAEAEAEVEVEAEAEVEAVAAAEAAAAEAEAAVQTPAQAAAQAAAHAAQRLAVGAEELIPLMVYVLARAQAQPLLTSVLPHYLTTSLTHYLTTSLPHYLTTLLTYHSSRASLPSCPNPNPNPNPNPDPNPDPNPNPNPNLLQLSGIATELRFLATFVDDRGILLGQLGYGLATLHAAVELLRSLCLGTQHDGATLDGAAPDSTAPDGAPSASGEAPRDRWASLDSRMFHRANAAAAAAAAAAAQGPPPAHLSISCSICRASFGFFTRRHHCRACGALCCDACSRQRAQLHGWAFARRLCDPCSQAQPPTAPTPSRAQGGGGGMPGGRRRRWEAAAAGGGGGAAPTPPGERRDARFDGPWYPGKHARTLPSEPAPTFPPLTSALHHTSSSQIPGHRGIGYGGGGGARPE
eukprot:scaffold48356_cov63-Phaeocystis_antarctica.AAC.1